MKIFYSIAGCLNLIFAIRHIIIGSPYYSVLLALFLGFYFIFLGNKNWIYYTIGKHSKRFRKWYHKTHNNAYLWGLITFSCDLEEKYWIHK